MPNTRLLPWIGAGISGTWSDPIEALHDADLDYKVVQEPAYTIDNVEIPGVIANRRYDNGEILGVVTPRYGVVQNTDAFSLLNPFCSTGVIEHVGMTHQGMVFMVMRTTLNFGFNGDEFELFVCAMNSFNAMFPLALIITPVRVVCQNMFRKLIKNDTAMLIKHGKFAADRIISVNAANTLLVNYRETFQEALTDSYSTYRFPSELDNFTVKMFPFTPEDSKHPRAKQTNERIKDLREEFVNDYYYASDNVKYRDSKLGIINAYYDWITHHVPMRVCSNFEDTRLGNLMNGTAVNTKLLKGA